MSARPSSSDRDLNGDRKAEIICVAGSGVVTAFRNISGLTSVPYGAGLAIGAGWSADNTRFADLTDDGRAEISYVHAAAFGPQLKNVLGRGPWPLATRDDECDQQDGLVGSSTTMVDTPG